MKPDFSVATKKLPIFLILFFIVLMIFASGYPPFIPNFLTVEYKTVRLWLEGFILFSLSVYALKSEVEILVVLLIVSFLYTMNWVLSTEMIENVLSHFNKFAFLLLFSRVLRRRNNIALLARDIWITFWVYCSIMGIIGYSLFISNLVSPTLIEEVWGGYSYYNYPFMGSFLVKGIYEVDFPRYTGFLSEPGMLGLFFGFNMVVAKQLVVDTKQCQRFLRLNMVAGLLTISYTFLIFLAFFFFLRLRMVARLVSNKSILIGLIGSIIIIIATLLTAILSNIDELLPYSSIDDRVLRYALSTEYLKEQSLSALVFGVGILPFHGAIERGASAGIVDVLVSRGIFLLGIWVYVLYMKAKHIPGLFAFILLYSLVLDYWHFPLFIIGLAIVASLGSAKNRGRIVQNPRQQIPYPAPTAPFSHAAL